MWDKAFITALTSLALSACGASTDGQTVSEGSAPSGNSALSVAENSNQSLDTKTPLNAMDQYSGLLPEAADPDIKNIQNRLSAELEKGLLPEIFTEAKSSPLTSVNYASGRQPMLPGGPEMLNGKFVMHLVKETITPLRTSEVLSCQAGGKLYRAHISAKPYTKRVPAVTNGTTETVTAYEMHVCVSERDMAFALAPSEK